ncbi:MAG: hypothetical protein KGI06_04100 [Candidatus Micrarchaeota archaeon]|nr:hypothetical protein [Candidatus Micrarchaeota archaeon]
MPAKSKTQGQPSTGIPSGKNAPLLRTTSNWASDYSALLLLDMVDVIEDDDPEDTDIRRRMRMKLMRRA